jgi:hypothetical protein
MKLWELTREVIARCSPGPNIMQTAVKIPLVGDQSWRRNIPTSTILVAALSMFAVVEHILPFTFFE